MSTAASVDSGGGGSCSRAGIGVQRCGDYPGARLHPTLGADNAALAGGHRTVALGRNADRDRADQVVPVITRWCGRIVVVVEVVMIQANHAPMKPRPVRA